MMTNPRTQASLLTVALALAGCSDDGGTTTDGVNPSSSTSTTSGAPETTDTPTSTVTPTTSTTSTTGPGTDTGDDETTEGATSLHPSTGVLTTEAAASCDDGVLNQDESDVDCGGGACSPCADGLQCTEASDCAVASCVGGVCAAPTCEDLVKNADETDVDCGGGCSACGDNLGCAEPGDCVSGVCTDAICSAATCGDGVQNQDETDVDCGGATCTGCLGDLLCMEDSDCLSGTCELGICAAPLCLVDADCAALDTECTVGVCQMPGFTCVSEPTNEGQPCEDGTMCFNDSVCQNGTCGGGTPLDCSDLADACHTVGCDPANGCTAEAKADGTACEDGDACTNLEVCSAGVCGGSLDDIFTEDFSDNSAGWTLGMQWAIGPAVASVGCSSGQDPASDHTATDDNGVAGVAIGGCIPNKNVHDYYCLESPTIDLSGAAADVHLSFWRWLNSDYTPYMKNTLEVFNGNSWAVIWETGASPGTYDGQWKFFSYEVSAHKNANFRARWCFNVGNGGVFSVAGWSLDDVTVGPAACMP